MEATEAGRTTRDEPSPTGCTPISTGRMRDGMAYTLTYVQSALRSHCASMKRLANLAGRPRLPVHGGDRRLQQHDLKQLRRSRSEGDSCAS